MPSAQGRVRVKRVGASGASAFPCAERCGRERRCPGASGGKSEGRARDWARAATWRALSVCGLSRGHPPPEGRGQGGGEEALRARKRAITIGKQKSTAAPKGCGGAAVPTKAALSKRAKPIETSPTHASAVAGMSVCEQSERSDQRRPHRYTAAANTRHRYTRRERQRAQTHRPLGKQNAHAI